MVVAVTFFSFAITFFSAAVTFFAWRNGHIIEETSIHTQNLIKEEMRGNHLLLDKISGLIPPYPS
jgi:hypothetical protein